MKDGWIGTSLPPLSKPFQNEMAPMKGDDGKPMGWTMAGSSPKEERRSIERGVLAIERDELL
jgi:hypothetical protein